MEQKPITQQEKTAKELRAEERLKRAKADIPPLAVVSCVLPEALSAIAPVSAEQTSTKSTMFCRRYRVLTQRQKVRCIYGS